jgi:hypothetical protein
VQCLSASDCNTGQDCINNTCVDVPCAAQVCQGCQDDVCQPGGYCSSTGTCSTPQSLPTVSSFTVNLASNTQSCFQLPEGSFTFTTTGSCTTMMDDPALGVRSNGTQIAFNDDGAGAYCSRISVIVAPLEDRWLCISGLGGQPLMNTTLVIGP